MLQGTSCLRVKREDVRWGMILWYASVTWLRGAIPQKENYFCYSIELITGRKWNDTSKTRQLFLFKHLKNLEESRWNSNYHHISLILILCYFPLSLSNLYLLPFLFENGKLHRILKGHSSTHQSATYVNTCWTRLFLTSYNTLNHIMYGPYFIWQPWLIIYHRYSTAVVGVQLNRLP